MVREDSAKTAQSGCDGGFGAVPEQGYKQVLPGLCVSWREKNYRLAHKMQFFGKFREKVRNPEKRYYDSCFILSAVRWICYV